MGRLWVADLVLVCVFLGVFSDCGLFWVWWAGFRFGLICWVWCSGLVLDSCGLCAIVPSLGFVVSDFGDLVGLCLFGFACFLHGGFGCLGGFAWFLGG